MIDDYVAERVARIRRLFPKLSERERCGNCNRLQPLERLYLTNRERLICTDDEACDAFVEAERSPERKALRARVRAEREAEKNALIEAVRAERAASLPHQPEGR